MRKVTSGARSWFCHEEPSAKTTRKQTSVFAPISSIVFLNCAFTIPWEPMGKSGAAILTAFRFNWKMQRSAGLARGVLASASLAHFAFHAYQGPPRRARSRLRLRLRAGAGAGAVPFDRERRFPRIHAADRRGRGPDGEEQARRDAALRHRREGRDRHGEAPHRQGR